MASIYKTHDPARGNAKRVICSRGWLGVPRLGDVEADRLVDGDQSQPGLRASARFGRRHSGWGNASDHTCRLIPFRSSQ